jgi:processive 1,2-diacylglycerol beta-glucosyltransferase
VEGAAQALAAAGVHVLAVAGHNARLAARLEALAASSPRVHPYGFTPRIAELMIASDLVVTLPGALTCGEARAAGRRLMLLDAMPGHGRENLQHELELGGAAACNPRPPDIVTSVLAALDRPGPAGPARLPGDWDRAFAAAMAGIGVGPEDQRGTAAGSAAAAGGPDTAVSGGHPHDHSTREVGFP